MKKYIISTFALFALLTACVDLDRNPLSEGSSENWFSSEQEVVLALNDLYKPALWRSECTRLFNTDRWTDDWNQRTQLYDWLGGTISSTWSQGATDWANHYKGIARANTILYSLDKAKEVLPDEKMAQYAGEAKFCRACFYSYQITLFGDVPFYEDYIEDDEDMLRIAKLGRMSAFETRRTLIEELKIYVPTLPQIRTSDQEFNYCGAAMGWLMISFPAFGIFQIRSWIRWPRFFPVSQPVEK